MKADILDMWDAEDLAKILAERFLDADDLMQALPEAANVGTFESEKLSEFIEQNWGSILRRYDPSELCDWVEESEFVDGWDAWEEELRMEKIEEEIEREEEFCWEVLQLHDMFRYRDYADLCGYPPKIKVS